MRHRDGWWAVVVVAACLSACAHGAKVSTGPDVPAARSRDAGADPVAKLIAEADAHLDAGLAELRQGHLNAARQEFDRAVDVYLTGPGGAYSSPRLSEAYRRTLDTIHVRELEALAAGDGFKETPSEPASIDEVGEMNVAEVPPTEETRQTAEAAVREEESDFPVQLNDMVLACIDVYKGRFRDWFAAALSRGQKYLPHIREVFAAEGIPQDLAYVALVESAFKTSALSRARAKGVWQFIAETGRRYGLQQDWWVDERSDPDKAARAAAQYLKQLYAMFGDWNLALAGYNAGEARVQWAVSRYKTTDFWRIARTGALRRETRNYVPLIHAAIVIAKAPEKYGIELAPEEMPAYEMVPIEGAVDLRVLAECAGTALDQIQTLNPELRRLATPAGRTYDLKVPAGSGATLLDCLAQVPAEKRVGFRTHVVARGENLWTIAARHGARPRDVAEANGISLSQRLEAGKELIIPIDPQARSAAAPARPAPAVTVAEVAAGAVGTIRITYRIKAGDTLGAIASQYGTTVQNLQAWNGLRSSRIVAGDQLTIYARKF